MKKVIILAISLAFLSFFWPWNISKIDAVGPSDYGLKEGDLISAIFSDDPDVYIINEHGYKRLFLNPEIFKFYSHLGGFTNIKLVTPEVRDAFPTVGLFRNCEKKDLKVYGFESDNEDKGKLRWIDTPGDQAVKDDPDFFKKVFCINDKEFNWYPRGQELKSVKEVPQYHRVTIPAIPASPAIPAIPAIPASLSQPLTPSITPKPASGSFTPTPTPVVQPATPAVPAIPAIPAAPATSATPTPTSSPNPSPTASVSTTPTPTYNVLFPIISSVLVSSITSNSAIISWSTNVPAYGTFTYGPSVLNTLGPQDTASIIQHSFVISGLAANTLYYFKVFSFNSYGYDSDFGGPGPQPVRTFSTLLTSTPTPTPTPIPTPTPTPTPVGTITLSIDEQPTQKRVYVAYNSNKAVAVLYEYGTTTSYGKTSGWNNWGGTTPSSYFTDNGYYIGETYLGQYLVLNTTYHVRAKATTGSGEIFYSNDYTFYLQEATPTPTASTSFDFNRDLYFGLVGNDVKQLQALLINQVSYPANLITGYFGNITRDAVKRLQAKYGVNPASGYFGEITRQALRTLISD